MSAYTPCACRDCMNITVSSNESKPELCDACKDAGCESYPTDNTHAEHCPTCPWHYECQRADAYDSAF